MRVKVVKGFASGPVWLCQIGSEEQGLRIDQEDGAPIVPVLPEFVGQYFCFIDWEKERIFRGGPDSFGGGFPQRNIFRNIIFGRLVSESWPDVPRVSWCLAIDGNPPERIDVSQESELASVLHSCSLSYSDRNMLCLGDEDCQKFIEELLSYRWVVHVGPHVWADIFLEMPDTSFPIPDIVRRELSQRLEKTMAERSSLQGKLGRLAKEQKDTDARIQGLEELEAKLVRYGAA